MATVLEIAQRTIYKPGDTVPVSGIYKAVHGQVHHDEHEITAVTGEPFPPCNHCGQHAQFTLVMAVHHIKNHKHFKK
jgi:hypothetical protein